MKKFLPRTSKNSQGFTLVELLVVIAIIAILAIIGITVYSGVQKNARDAKRKADVDAISQAMEANFNATAGTYPAGNTTTFYAAGAPPSDPTNSAPYTYTFPSAGTSYCMCALMETNTNGNSGANCATGATTHYCKKNQQQ